MTAVNHSHYYVRSLRLRDSFGRNSLRDPNFDQYSRFSIFILPAIVAFFISGNKIPDKNIEDVEKKCDKSGRANQNSNEKWRIILNALFGTFFFS